MSKAQPIHFIGISGIGMSGLARVLKQRGFSVRGSSDRLTSLTEQLVSEGIPVYAGHNASHLGDAETVVVSSAIAADNAELREAQARGLDIVRRGTMLARMMAGTKSIAVAGTHGKTTSSAMLAHILECAGREPTWTVGGELVDYGVNARDGRGAWFVAESDESDRSFLELQPFAELITNIENDHVASDAEFTGLVSDFERFAALADPAGFVCIGTDEAAGAGLAQRPRRARTVTFGSAAQDYRMDAVATRSFAMRFDAWRAGAHLGSVDLPMVGEMNARNALGALAVAMELGIDFPAIAAALGSFHGVRRRFDVLARTSRMTVVDDYAHHPTAIAATIAAARKNSAGPVIAAFQPHRYTRTKYLANDFAVALRRADHVVLTPIYAASEAPIEGVDARTIGEPLRAAGTPVDYVDSIQALPERLLGIAPKGATVLLMGAGSITVAASALAGLIEVPAAAGARG